MSEIVLSRLNKTYPHGVVAVADLDLTVHSGEFLVLVGPSGCGKSTILRMIAGIEPVTSGRVQIGDREVTRLDARERDVAMVFQNYALYPHMDVRRNLGYGLRVRKTPKPEVNRRVHEVAKLLGLVDLLDRKPAALSGGQRQRVAMGRAIVREPTAFLMDEPLSNLDAKLRVVMRSELARLHARLGVTTVYVTHDQVEAMTLGQRVAILCDGRLQQVATPRELYHSPANIFVATFIGSPAMNLTVAEVRDKRVSFAGRSFPLPEGQFPGLQGKVILGVRPTDFEYDASAAGSETAISADVTVVEELGSETHLNFLVDAPYVDPDRAGDLSQGESVEEGCLLAIDNRAPFTAIVDPRVRVYPGDRVRLVIDSEAFYFFDPVTHANLYPDRETASRASESVAPRKTSY
jgi:multiple sugar transport system ATP-binding protein